MLAKFGRSISEMKRISPIRPLLLPLILWLTLKAMRVPTAPSRLWGPHPLKVTLPLLNIAVPIYIYLARPLCWLCMRYVCRCSSRPTSTTTGSCRRASSATSSPSRPTSSPLSTSESEKKIECPAFALLRSRRRPQERQGEEEEMLRCYAATLNQRAAT